MLGKRRKVAVERQRAQLVALAREINCFLVSIQEAKFIASESEENIKSWSEGMGSHLSVADENVEKLSKCLNEIETRAKSKLCESYGAGEQLLNKRWGLLLSKGG